MKCAGCLKVFKAANCIKCTAITCDRSFCSLCVNTSTMTADRKKLWKCFECCTSEKKTDNTSTPHRTDLVVPQDSQHATKDSLTSTPERDDSAIKDLTNEVRCLVQEICSLKGKLEDATKSLTRCHERLDELHASMEKNEVRLKILEARDSEIALLKAEISELKTDVSLHAQHQLRNEIEVCGIHEHPNENLHHTILVAARLMGVEMENRDIDWAMRVGPKRKAPASSNKESSNPASTDYDKMKDPPATAKPADKPALPRPVVVRLLRKSTCDQFLSAAKTRRNITSADLEIAGPPLKIFYNERLTKTNRQLFRKARDATKLHNFFYCWCTQGSIYIRKQDGKPAIRILSQQQLDSITGSLPTAAADTTTAHA